MVIRLREGIEVSWCHSSVSLSHCNWLNKPTNGSSSCQLFVPKHLQLREVHIPDLKVHNHDQN
jgi:hypothetical protein